MRWDALFTDLEGQFSASSRLDLDAEIAERMRTEAASIELADRLRGSLGLEIGIQVRTGAVFDGTLRHAGGEALVLQAARHQVLVPYAAVIHYIGLSRLAVVETSKVRQRLGLASALRGLLRDRTRLSVLTGGGTGGEATLHGVIDRVGRDHLDLAVTENGEDRRACNVLQVVTVPFSALVALRSARSADR